VSVWNDSNHRTTGLLPVKAEVIALHRPPDADRATGSKEVRAEPFAAQVQGGNVWLAAGSWVNDFLEEAESWPNGKHKDQIDAAVMAFSHLTMAPLYTYAGFQD